MRRLAFFLALTNLPQGSEAPRKEYKKRGERGI